MTREPQKQPKKSSTKEAGQCNRRAFRPSEFMRARRPELFSDSTLIQEPRLTRELFEYQLDTLTNRKEETEFEHFCRRLAEKELCPNLLPQTGPTGGGDSKVDSETYPVADEISLRWYEGIGREAGQERWAFAFSAKQDWRAKVQSDVEKIANTRRAYKLVYFITNQFVKDKARSEVEDELSKKYHISVHILDRSWITSRVFEHDRLQLAIETLNLSGYDVRTGKAVGPLDVKREAELTKLEEQISDPHRYRGVEYQLAEDCLQAALLARGLALPRVEIEGRFARAEQIANRVGHTQQRLGIAYNRAWTAYWWFEDLKQFTELYDEVEKFAVTSNQATDLELLANLWAILSASVRTGQLDCAASKLNPRTVTLRNALEKLAVDQNRPNNALWARTNRLLMDFQDAIEDPQRMDAVLREFQGILIAAEGLIAYPINAIAKIVRELGNLLTDNPRYDELLENVVTITQWRVSESEAGRVLLERGFQKLRKGKTYDAIRFCGRAQQKLALRECRGELVAALLGCGLAYESAGLLWAARANVLAAANQALSEFIEHGVILPQALACLRKLVWLELQLGRVPYVLQWIDAESVIAQHLALTDERKTLFLKERTQQDRVLGLLLLKTRFSDLQSLEFLPTLLDRFGLENSWMALLYALGYEDYLRSQNVIPESESQDAVRDFFAKWVTQPAASDLPSRPELLSEDTIALRSFVLGSEVTAYANNDFASICHAEWILAALEALLATSLEKGVFPHAQEFKINIEPSEAVKGQPEYQFCERGGGQTVNVRHNPKDQTIAKGDTSWLQHLVLGIAPQIAIIENLDSFARRVFGDEGGLARAFNFSDPLIPVKNILGDVPRFRLSDWEAHTDGERFTLRRSVRWDHGLYQMDDSTKSVAGRHRPAEGEPPEALLDISRIKHTDRRVFSLISIPLWNRAGWRATIYLIAQDSNEPPLLALGFAEAGAARTIFQDWRSKLGDVDKDDQLRVSIITGIDKRQPFTYRVVIGTNPIFPKDDSRFKQLVVVSRIHQMYPQDSKNLDAFVISFERKKRYFLLPAHLPEAAASPRVFYDLAIEKRTLRVCPAWQIGENDPDAIALQADDDPIIPQGVQNAPVMRALEKVARRSGKTP